MTFHMWERWTWRNLLNKAEAKANEEGKKAALSKAVATLPFAPERPYLDMWKQRMADDATNNDLAATMDQAIY